MPLKNALLMIITAFTVTNGATAMFDTAHAAALQQASVYAIAGEVMNSAFTGDISAEARLYTAGDQIHVISQAEFANLAMKD